MTLLCALVGLLTGSLLNWVSDYLPRFTSSKRTPSHKTTSRPELALWRLVKPSTSEEGFVLGIGVELFTALLFACLWGRFGPSWKLPLVALGCAFFLLVAIVDLKYRLVPNVLVYPAMVVVLLFHSIPPMGNTLAALLGGLVGLAPFLLTALVRPGGLGGGDVKLAALIGLTVGFPQVLWALTIGILAGGITAILLLLTRRWDMKSHIPYAPFLCLGVIAALIYDPFPLILPP